jgi:hypothetical protein
LITHIDLPSVWSETRVVDPETSSSDWCARRMPGKFYLHNHCSDTYFVFKYVTYRSII